MRPNPRLAAVIDREIQLKSRKRGLSAAARPGLAKCLDQARHPRMPGDQPRLQLAINLEIQPRCQFPLKTFNSVT